jgi:hypothetical protein
MWKERIGINILYGDEQGILYSDEIASLIQD